MVTSTNSNESTLSTTDNTAATTSRLKLEAILLYIVEKIYAPTRLLWIMKKSRPQTTKKSFNISKLEGIHFA